MISLDSQIACMSREIKKLESHAMHIRKDEVELSKSFELRLATMHAVYQTLTQLRGLTR